jgi:cell pole-organizing protein PopZ
MAEENEDAEPSMDNILSSIRKILSEDEKSAEVAGDPPSVATEALVAQNEPKQEIDMVSAVEVSEPVSSNEASGSQGEVAESPLTASEGYDANLNASEAVTEAVTEAFGEESPATFSTESNILELTQQMIAQPPSDIGAGDSILSNGPSANSTDALQELAKALLSKRDIAIGNKDMTLEGLVREILRPLLREWLDQNLPYLIERLVKKEIDHMVNRAERLDL